MSKPTTANEWRGLLDKFRDTTTEVLSDPDVRVRVAHYEELFLFAARMIEERLKFELENIALKKEPKMVRVTGLNVDKQPRTFFINK